MGRKINCMLLSNYSSHVWQTRNRIANFS